MALPKKAFGVQMDAAELMVGGVRNHLEQFSKRGIDEAFITEYESTLASVKDLNQAQEKLKADLKSKTEELEKKLTDLENKYRELKKVVKLEFPSSSWKEFGLDDKH